MIKAEIVKEVDDCLWLHIHRENGEGCSYALLGDEIDAILEACITWNDNKARENVKIALDMIKKHGGVK
jgi:hypothetical protein